MSNLLEQAITVTQLPNEPPKSFSKRSASIVTMSSTTASRKKWPI